MDQERKAKIKETLARLRELGLRDVGLLLREQFRYWVRILRRSYRLFVENRGPYQANALAYRTMVSLVPMLAFMIYLLTWIMGEGAEADLKMKLQDLMQNYLVPESKIIEKTFEVISGFIAGAKSGTIIGFVILLLTSVFLINAIETIFNNIWHITRRRSIGWKILSFTSMTILIPLLLGISIYTTARISVDTFTELLTQNAVARHIPLVPWAWQMFKGIGLPLGTAWVLFLALYKWLPNTRVETAPALISSFLAALCFELGKMGFSYFAVEMVGSKQLVWGSLGVFLVFLMWVYLIWLIVLFGAQLTYVIQNYRYVLRINPDLEKRVGETYLACRVMLEIGKNHLRGDQVPSVRKLAGRLEVEVPRLQKILSQLIDANLVILGTTGDQRGNYEEVYVPGRDLGSITVAEVIRTVNDAWRIPSLKSRNSLKPSMPKGEAGSTSLPTEAAATPEHDALDKLLNQSRVSLENELDISFRDLLEGLPANQ
jgi:membrane protein